MLQEQMSQIKKLNMLLKENYLENTFSSVLHSDPDPLHMTVWKNTWPVRSTEENCSAAQGRQPLEHIWQAKSLPRKGQMKRRKS